MPKDYFEPCMCGAVDCPRCFPEIQYRDDEEEDLDEEIEDDEGEDDE